MKRSGFSEEQIIGILREAETGSPVRTVCAAHNISTATYHAWKRKFGGMEVSEAKRLGALKEENSPLKRLLADQAVPVESVIVRELPNWMCVFLEMS
jgi:putative transposase